MSMEDNQMFVRSVAFHFRHLRLLRCGPQEASLDQNLRVHNAGGSVGQHDQIFMAVHVSRLFHGSLQRGIRKMAAQVGQL